MEALSLAQICAFAAGELTSGTASATVENISTDSRSVTRGELFLALRGEHFDGHAYVETAARAGAAGAIVERDFAAVGLSTEFPLIRVDDTLTAYQRIAAAYRRSLAMRVIGITGSNGKTSTKDFAAAVLNQRYRVLKTEGNLNNHVGVPRMLLRANRSHEIAVLEMGMNHPGEIAPLAQMAQPQAAIITNIGRAHLEFLGTREGIAQEKGMLAEAVGPDGTVILNGEDEFTPSIARRTSAKVVMIGSPGSALEAIDITQTWEGSQFVAKSGSERQIVHLPVPGRHMITNALLALAAGQVFGVSLAEGADALAEIRLTKGRMELKSLRGRTIFDDTYNANPDSMIAALETLAGTATIGRRFAVLGKMGELGAAAADGYREVGSRAAAREIDLLIAVDSEAAPMAAAARAAGLSRAVAVRDIESAADLLANESQPGDLILVKGSRAAAMERLLPALSARLTAKDELIRRPAADPQLAK